MRWALIGEAAPRAGGGRGVELRRLSRSRRGRSRDRSPARVAFPALALISLTSGCAKEEPPPGARPDTNPPRVESITPGRDTVVPGFDGDARVRFNEPVRVGADLQRQLIASPAFRYQVRTGFSDVRIRPPDGWIEGVVYCFELPAGIADLLGNRTPSPVDFCFSTGPPITETEVTGQITDRVTGQAVSDARALFYRTDGDTVPYTAVADREGRFRLRALPVDSYTAYAFIDRTRNLRLDRRLEPYDSTSFVLDTSTASATLGFSLVEPDTTPPVLVRVEAVDSLTARLEFDDHLEVEQPDARVEVTRGETGRRWPVASHRVGAPEEVTPLETETEVAPPEDDAPESTEPETIDRTEAEPGVTAPDAPAAEELGRGGGRSAPELPSRRVTVRFSEPLLPGEYRLEASGFRNLRRLVGGGDTTFVYTPPDPVPDTMEVERPDRESVPDPEPDADSQPDPARRPAGEASR